MTEKSPIPQPFFKEESVANSPAGAIIHVLNSNGRTPEEIKDLDHACQTCDFHLTGNHVTFKNGSAECTGASQTGVTVFTRPDVAGKGNIMISELGNTPCGIKGTLYQSTRKK